MTLPASRLFSSALLTLGLALASCALHANPSVGFKDLFNGHDLTGWDGNKSFWSVQDGVITGKTTAEIPLKANTFLVWKDGTPGNFELRATFRLTGDNEKKQANSGIQYRSKLLDPATFVVGGYQADIDSSGKYVGMLYEEKGRGILMAPGEKIRVTAAAADAKKPTIEKLAVVTPTADVLAAYKIGDWNELVIIAEGNHLRHYLNGKLTADVTDDDPALAPHDGVLALQLHTGPPMTIQFKNLQLKKLP